MAIDNDRSEPEPSIHITFPPSIPSYLPSFLLACCYPSHLPSLPPSLPHSLPSQIASETIFKALGVVAEYLVFLFMGTG